jgi:hypothetical protein
MDFYKSYIISNNVDSKEVILKDLPYWFMLYDKTIDDMNIRDFELWQSSEFCDYCLKVNGLCLQWISNQTYSFCETAILQNGMALEYVDPVLIRLKLCQQAVNQSRFAIMWVPEKFQTEQLCLASIKGNASTGFLNFNLKDMLTNTDPECIENGYVIKHIFNPTPKVIKYALEVTPSAYCYVKNKTPELDSYVIKCKEQIKKNETKYKKLTKVVNLFMYAHI